jgi:hypothetical protein
VVNNKAVKKNERMVELVDTKPNYFEMMVLGYLAFPFAGSNPAAAHKEKLKALSFFQLSKDI